MMPINRTYAPIQALVEELVRCGMTHAVTSPGSRNAPIALTLAAEKRLEAVSVIDERAAGFVALGMAKASGRPVAVTCTSGSAAANLLPAVVEAWQARVPLLVLTADRPPELRDVGAGQAIDQIGLYGTAVKWFVELGNADPHDAAGWNAHVRATTCRAYAAAGQDRPGPVHVNIPLREPLAPVAESLPAEDWLGRGDGAPWTAAVAPIAVPSGSDVEHVVRRIDAATGGAIVCGPITDPVAEAVARLARATGWPVLAEPASGLRCGPHDRSHVVAHYDVLLRDERFAAAHRPELVLRVGDTPTSKPLRAWMATADHQVVIDPHGAWHEPTRQADAILRADPAATCAALASAVGGDATVPGPPESWLTADAIVPAALAEVPGPFEAAAYAALADVATDGGLIWTSSSMPVREVEAFFPTRPAALRFLSNRGANGIDGVVASATGAALATGSRTWVLIGEVALLHDLGGLMASQRAGAGLTVICTNNGGGGIFDFLPLPTHADPVLFEEHVATPTGLDLAKVADLAGMTHTLASTAAEVAEAAREPGLVELRTDRADSVRGHRDLYRRVGARLERPGTT